MLWGVPPVTCYLRYLIVDPYKLKEFEHYVQALDPAGREIRRPAPGYFLPSEGANNVALRDVQLSGASPPTSSTASRFDAGPRVPGRLQVTPRTPAASLSYERSFFRPVLDGDLNA